MTLADFEAGPYRTILLDRDGTINRQRQGDYVKCPAEFEFLPGVPEAIARLAHTVDRIIIVTNQRGIGRGRMTEKDLAAVHASMTEEIRRCGGRIDAIYYSPALSDDDLSRKPNTGMWQQIRRDFPDVDPATTIMVGDGDCDEQFARNCGIAFVRVDKQNVVFVKDTTD